MAVNATMGYLIEASTGYHEIVIRPIGLSEMISVSVPI